MAAAAIISLYVYLNFQQGPDDLPADEVALTFATVAIHSCAEAANAAAVNKQIQQLVEADVQARAAESAWAQQQQQQPVAGGEQPLFGCAQVGKAERQGCRRNSATNTTCCNYQSMSRKP